MNVNVHHTQLQPVSVHDFSAVVTIQYNMQSSSSLFIFTLQLHCTLKCIKCMRLFVCLFCSIHAAAFDSARHYNLQQTKYADTFI